MKKLSALLAGAIVAHSAAMAAEITVLSGGAIEPGLHAAAHAFEEQTGHHVKITFNTAPQIAKRVAAGDVFDVVIAPPAAMENYARDGKVAAERVNVGRVGLGVVVRPGAITEILLFREKGLRYVGPLPPEIQNYTSYAAAPMTSSRNAELARTFAQFLGTTGKPLFVAAGIE